MRRVAHAAACICFIAASFALWGMFQSLLGKTPASVKTDRKLVLKAVQKVDPKDASKESKVLLNDPNISEKWDLQKTQATRAWEVSQGSKEINVCIIDTGADINHKDSL